MKKISFLALFVLLSNTAFALPTISSADDQTFDQNDAPQQLRDITVTEDTADTYITAGSLKITIPDDIEVIFDTGRTNEGITLYGTAVDNGKVKESPTVSYENGDKTLVIPIDVNFDPGQYMVITKVFVKGFHSQGENSVNMYMTINDGTEKYYDDKYIFVRTSAYEDTHEPETPTNVTVEDAETGVTITWKDPTDLDLSTIQIMKGVNDAPVDGTPFVDVAAGVEEYNDTDVLEGDTVKYILRASDGRNVSENTEEIQFVVGSTPTADDTTTDETTTDDTADDTTDTATADDTVADDTTTDDTVADDTATDDTTADDTTTTFTDIEGHWASAEIIKLANEGIVTGQSATLFNPDGDLNRAETSALLYRLLGLGEPAPLENGPFPDVPADVWFAPYVSTMKDLGMINGYEDGTYGPDNNVTRAEFVKMAMEIYYYLADGETKDVLDGWKNGSPTTAYDDLDDDWYTPYVTMAANMGFIHGYECETGRCFGAQNSITRAEATVILNNMFYAQ